MERALFITTENPFPADGGGKLRTRGILEPLTRQVAVDLLTYQRPSHPELEDAKSRLSIVQVPNTVSPKRAAFRSLYRVRTAGYMGHADVDMMAAAKALCREHRYRDIFIDNTMLGYFIAPLRRLQPQARFVTVAHNFETGLVQQWVTLQSSTFRRLFFSLSGFYTAIVERRVCRQSDLLLATSRDEAERFTDLCPDARSKTAVVPSSIAVESYARYRDDEPDAESIVLSGLMNYFPNVAGARHFHAHVYPLLKKARPHLKWYIVGRNCHPSVLDLAKDDPSIIVTGEVPDAMEYVVKGSVVVVPLLHGSGTRLKILEAWAVDRPVVSTSKGCEGIECRHDHDILIADTPQAFADAVLRLLDDRELAQRIVRHARQTLLTFYDAPMAERRLIAVLQREPRPSRGPSLPAGDLLGPSPPHHGS
jgi:polysaccharide biosynthesis protein PslH